ncbi:MAG TPA: M48 family metalloprotease [Phycisphaerales bacterium]|nr:M48 family metalloprotease [Phycisphaerales bacterium]
MLHVLIILALALSRLPDMTGDATWEAPFREHAWLVIPATFSVWIVFHLYASRVRTMMGRAGSASRIARLYRFLDAARIMSMLVLLAGVSLARWDEAVRSLVGSSILLDELLIASPVLLTLIFTWWSMAPIERLMQEAQLIRKLDEGGVITHLPTRWQSVWQHVRFSMLLVLVPLSLMIAWHDLLRLAPVWLPSQRAWITTYYEWLSWGGVAGMLLLAPWLMKALWDTVPLEASELRERIMHVCRTHRVRVTGPLVWRTYGSMVNGAILGMFWPFRYLLLTDALLERMQPSHLEAIVAHEVAHVRYRHMIWLGVVVASSAVASGWLLELLAAQLPVTHSLLSPIVASVIAFASAIAAFIFASQRFEWQADAFSATHLAKEQGAATVSDTAVTTVASTLGEVAYANGMSIDRISIRHGSIATRQRKVRALAGLPLDRLPIDRTVRVIKITSFLLLTLGIAAMFVPWG